MNLKDQINEINQSQSWYYTNKLLKQQEAEKRREQAAAFKDIKTTIEAAALDLFIENKDKNNYYNNIKNFEKDFYNIYIYKNKDITENQKSELKLILKKQFLKLEKDIITYRKQKQREAEKTKKEAAKNKNDYLFFEILIFCFTFVFCWYFMNN